MGKPFTFTEKYNGRMSRLDRLAVAVLVYDKDSIVEHAELLDWLSPTGMWLLGDDIYTNHRRLADQIKLLGRPSDVSKE